VYHSDNLVGIPLFEKWDLVVGNPPHFSDEHAGSLILHDPGWRIHREFFSQVGAHLKPGGVIVLQENSEGSTAESFREMIEKAGLEISFVEFGSKQRTPHGHLYYIGIVRRGKLLVVVISDQSKAVVDGMREAAISSLITVTGPDREGLVKRYITKAGSGGDIAEKILKDHIAQDIKLRMEIAGLELKIENLKAQHEQELARCIEIETLLIQGHQAEVRRLKAERDAFEL
jgi:hypothetical protein